MRDVLKYSCDFQIVIFKGVISKARTTPNVGITEKTRRERAVLY